MWFKKDQFTINVSNRKIVQGLIEDLKIEKDKQIKVMRAIDKLDKPGFGLKGVEELLKKERKDKSGAITKGANLSDCLLYTSPSPRDREKSRMPSSA